MAKESKMQEVVIQLAAESNGTVVATCGGTGIRGPTSPRRPRSLRCGPPWSDCWRVSSRASARWPTRLRWPSWACSCATPTWRTLATSGSRPLEQSEGRLALVSLASACLNLPWELLPGRDGRFLVSDGRWAIRRAVRPSLPDTGLPLVPRPLRILFTACAPQHAGLPVLDYEREEEAILRIADRLGGKIFLDIAEAGTSKSQVTSWPVFRFGRVDSR